MKPFSLLILQLLLVFGCNSGPAVEVTNRTVEVQGLPRSYRLVVPREIESGSPLVIAWHGLGDTVEGMANYSQLDQLAAKHRFVLIYPESKGNWQVPMAGGRTEKVETDLLLFDGLVEEAAATWAIDREQVYIVGMSQGATFVHWLADQRDGQIAAAVAFAGGPSSGCEIGADGPPVLLICGADDPAFDTMKKAQLTYRDVRGSADMISLDGVGHEWTPRVNEIIWQFLVRHRVIRQ